MDASNDSRKTNLHGRRARPFVEPPGQGRRDPDWSILNQEERHAIDQMYDIGWGRIEDLPIRNSIPLITKGTKMFERLRPGRIDRGRSVGPAHPNRKLRRQHVEFLLYCRQVGNGILARVEVCDGLPSYWSPAKALVEQRA